MMWPIPNSNGFPEPLREMNTCHAATSGQFCSGAGVRDERGGAPPAVGEHFMVFRVGRLGGELENKNAGNANSVALHLARAADPSGAQPVGGTGTHITMFEVAVTAPFDAYSRFNKGLASDPSGHAVGRSQSKNTVAYAFPAGGAWVQHQRGRSVAVRDFNAYLQKHYGFQDADEAGTMKAAEALRAMFAETR